MFQENTNANSFTCLNTPPYLAYNITIPEGNVLYLGYKFMQHLTMYLKGDEQTLDTSNKIKIYT
jgi:hypothetical protein